MKKIITVLAIILAFAMFVAAFTFMLKSVKSGVSEETTPETDPVDPDDSTDSVPDTEVEMITFYFFVNSGDVLLDQPDDDLYPFTCPKGMTWNEYVNSEYNGQHGVYIEIETPGEDWGMTVNGEAIPELNSDAEILDGVTYYIGT